MRSTRRRAWLPPDAITRHVVHPVEPWLPLPDGSAGLVQPVLLAWELSDSLEWTFCLSALEQALAMGVPEIFNTDQGTQYTSLAFTGRLEQAGVAISMDGRGRALYNSGR